MSEEEKCSCGYPPDTFACKIRHLTFATENLKRDREASSGPNFGLKENK